MHSHEREKSLQDYLVSYDLKKFARQANSINETFVTSPGNITGGSDLGKRKNRWEDDGAAGGPGCKLLGSFPEPLLVTYCIR